jgi:hypothetical protein
MIHATPLNSLGSPATLALQHMPQSHDQGPHLLPSLVSRRKMTETPSKYFLNIQIGLFGYLIFKKF